MTGHPITSLRRGQCRFAITPFEAESHLFCGEPVEYEGCPYCEAHANRCFDRRTPAQRRADAEKAAKARSAKLVNKFPASFAWAPARQAPGAGE